MDKELLLLTLRQSKNEPFILVNELIEAKTESKVKAFFEELNSEGFQFQFTIDNNYQITREQRARLAILGFLNGHDFDKIINELIWQEFELLTTIVGDEFGYIAKTGLNFSAEDRKYQIDVILKASPYVLFIDCKHYSGTGKKSVLKKAAEEQVIRVEAVKENLDILQEKISIKGWKKIIFIPMIVTWLDDEIFFHQFVPVVPFTKLRSFFQDFYLYYEDIFKIEI
ncbi:MAG: hypothetical protein JJE41_15385 [Candidatus Heimdallarchaeota archaeon]|nr:hypothetical protein [Candidatus Heimdallarchaeota archaeon]